MIEKYIKEGFDVIKAPDYAVDEAVNIALSAQHSRPVMLPPQKKKTTQRIPKTLLAACLVLVFVMGLAFGFNRNNFMVTKSSEHNFVITANAAELGNMVDNTAIGAYSSEGGGGWAMYLNYEHQLLPKSPNYFASYVLSGLKVKGENIDSVTFSVDTKGVYFALAPGGHSSFYGEELTKSKQVKELEKFSSYSSLNNSQYTSDELTRYRDGLSKGWIYCDKFTYHNTDKKDVINLGNCLEIIAESNHADPEISSKLDEMWTCEEEITEIKRLYSNTTSGKTTDRHNELLERIGILSEEIQEGVLDGAEIDVMVRYTDGEVSTRTLRLSIETVTDEELTYKWLFIR